MNNRWKRIDEIAMSIQTELETISRRSFLKKAGAAFMAVCASLPVYSFFLERFWLDITSVHITFNGLPKAFSGMRIVHISDLHMGNFYHTNHLKTVVEKVNQLKPDLICFTGDLVEDKIDMLKDCIPLLKELTAPLGKISILGNHDYRIGKEREIIKCLTSSGFIFLKNSHTSITRMGGTVFIAGVDDMFGGDPNIPEALQGIPKNQFTILLAHEPDVADTASKHPVHLQLSGHSHGGQIRLPIAGPLFTPAGAQKYVKGLYSINSSNFLLYVNRGIGTTYLPFRFDCRPEITMITLTSAFH